MTRNLLLILSFLAALSSAATPVLAQDMPPPKPKPQAPAPSPTPATALLNLNAATKADLEKLPGIGPSMAQRILDYREKNGSFKKVEELMNVQGIGEKAFLKLRTLVTAAPIK
jgi:competence protein ComEA